MKDGATSRADVIQLLIDQGECFFHHRFRRVFGAYDSRIVRWADECEQVLMGLSMNRDLVQSRTRAVRSNIDSVAIRHLLDLLRGASSDTISAKPGPSFPRSALAPVPDMKHVSVVSRDCFVMMPFSESFKRIYDNAIRQALIDVKCQPERGDEVTSPGIITHQIFEGILKAHFCIADISGLNPNVMYELGFAHAKNKPTIIIRQRTEARAPFDIAHFRYIEYDAVGEGLSGLYKSLVRTITSIVEGRSDEATL